MSETQDNLQLAELIGTLNLGEMIGVPVPMTGGLMHRMYAIQTTAGKFAVKALIPEIMQRPAAMQNFITSERIANLAASHIPALPAKILNGNTIQEACGRFFLIFDWVEGKTLKPSEINSIHCEKIGAILAGIHKTDFSGLGIMHHGSDDRKLTDWNFYLQKGQENHSEWVKLLSETVDQLNDWNALAIDSAKILSSRMVISHGDLDPKNVMWIQDDPLLIDWESAGYVNPMQDLMETAVYWSENETGEIDKNRFFTFVYSYKNLCGPLRADWRMVLASGFLGKLDWLEYSLKRSLWIECSDEKEQQLGTEQAAGTIRAIKRYADMISEIEKWLFAELS